MEETRTPSPFKFKKIWLIPALLILAAVLTAGAVFLLDPYDNRIVENVSVGGIQIGGMTRREARDALQAGIQDTICSQPMVLQLPDETLTFHPEDLNLSVNCRRAVREAYRIGRTGSREERDSQAAAEHSLSLQPYLRIKSNIITLALQDYAARYDTVYTEPGFVLEGNAPALAEESYDPNAACQTLLITTGIPQVNLDCALVLDQLLYTYGENQLELTIPEIPAQQEAPDTDLEAIYDAVSTAPVDTGVNRETYGLVPGSYGYDFDLEAAAALLETAGPGETFSVPMRYVEPQVLGQDAFFQDVLGSCDTPHTDNENRNENLRLACAAMDGVILQPGEEFSYNLTLGERTKERGWKAAPAYSGFDLVASYGGGICQGSSTLYYCTLLADLEILERVSHGYASSYIPIGTDATVSWWGPDFRFRNNTNFPIMIRAEVSDGYVRVKLLGTDEKDYYIEIETEVRGTSQTHRYVKSYKLKYDKETGELISRDYEASSSYLPNYY